MTTICMGDFNPTLRRTWQQFRSEYRRQEMRYLGRLDRWLHERLPARPKLRPHNA